jgi:hypothetical protein
MGEGLHRIVVGMVFLATLAFLFFTYIGIDTYIDSGRSLMGDSRSSVRYQWKTSSCDDLFQQAPKTPLPPEVQDLCNTARMHNVPPLAIKSIIDERVKTEGLQQRPLEAKAAEEFFDGVKRSLLEGLPALQKRYAGHYRDIRGMWFFFPFVAGALGLYYYSRFFTPVLHDKVKLRFEKVMFGKNKYLANWDKFLKQNRP